MNSQGLFQKLKRGVVGIIGRERANRIAGPYHDRRARRQTLEFLAHLPAGDLLVNLGCGHRPIKGWINVDRARGPQVQVVWDLTTALPFPDLSCSAIFSEHLIEHVTREQAASLIEECYRMLKPGGVLRVSTPDAERYLRSYCGDGEFLRHANFAEPVETPLERINQMMREYGQHLWVYDAESLILLLGKAGFRTARRSEFGNSAHLRMQGIDAAERAFESLYIEGVK